MPVGLVQSQVVKKWNDTYAKGSDKSFPNLDLVRLERWFFERKPGKLLEYGFGCGVNLLYLLESGYEAQAVDSSIEAKKLVESKLAKRPDLQARVKLHNISTDAKKLFFADQTFDFIVCVSVLSLLGSQAAVESMLSEFSRILKPGGKIIVDINGPQSDFARESERLGNDVYVHRGFSQKEEPFECYCPPDAQTFAELVKKYFVIDDVGYSSHKYFHSEIEEFIVCAHKKRGNSQG